MFFQNFACWAKKNGQKGFLSALGALGNHFGRKKGRRNFRNCFQNQTPLPRENSKLPLFSDTQILVEHWIWVARFFEKKIN